MFRQNPELVFEIPLYIKIIFILLIPLGFLVGNIIRRQITIKIISFSMIIIQILLFYWYSQGDFLFTEGLPIYLCRIMMFVIGWNVLINNIRNYYNFFFSLMGITGAVLSFIVPDMSHFNFPHITNFSFVVGHFLLLVISVFLLKENSNNSIKEKKRQWFVITWMILLLQVLSSFVATKKTGIISNYGFVYELPVVKTTNPFINCLLIFVFLTLSGIIIEVVFSKFKDFRYFSKKERDVM